MEALARVDIRARTHRAATDVTVSLLDMGSNTGSRLYCIKIQILQEHSE